MTQHFVVMAAPAERCRLSLSFYRALSAGAARPRGRRVRRQSAKSDIEIEPKSTCTHGRMLTKLTKHTPSRLGPHAQNQSPCLQVEAPHQLDRSPCQAPQMLTDVSTARGRRTAALPTPPLGVARRTAPKPHTRRAVRRARAGTPQAGRGTAPGRPARRLSHDRSLTAHVGANLVPVR